MPCDKKGSLGVNQKLDAKVVKREAVENIEIGFKSKCLLKHVKWTIKDNLLSDLISENSYLALPNKEENTETSRFMHGLPCLHSELMGYLREVAIICVDISLLEIMHESRKKRANAKKGWRMQNIRK